MSSCLRSLCRSQINITIPLSEQHLLCILDNCLCKYLKILNIICRKKGLRTAWIDASSEESGRQKPPLNLLQGAREVILPELSSSTQRQATPKQIRHCQAWRIPNKFQVKCLKIQTSGVPTSSPITALHCLCSFSLPNK